MDFADKMPVEVAVFLRENGVSDDICELFEGKQSSLCMTH